MGEGENHLYLYRLRGLLLTLIALQVLALAQTSTWEAKNRAGEKAFQEGKLADAEGLFAAALKDAQQFGPRDLRLAPILNNLALVAFVRNNFVGAQENFEQAISIIEAARGSDDPLLLPILDNLTRLYIKQWAFDNAIQTSWRSCHIREKKLGVEHPDTATNLNQLATLYFDSVRLLPHEQPDQTQPAGQAANPESSAGIELDTQNVQDDAARLTMAASLYEKTLAAQEERFGADNLRLVDVLENLANVSRAEGNLAQAEQSHARAIRIIEKTFGPEDLKLVEPLHQMADLKAQDGSYSESEALYQRALRIDEQKLGPKDPSLGALLMGYAAVLEKMQKPDQAKELTKRAASLPKPRTPAALPIHQAASLAPYVLRFERAVFDRYSGVRQTCLLVQTDGRLRVEEQQHENGSSGSAIVPAPKMPDGGMPDTGAPQERLDDRSSKGVRSAKVFEDSVDADTLQQLKAILSAKNLRDIRGVYPQRGGADYYGTERIAVSVPRDDGVQTFAFPDSYTRQPFDNVLKPLLKWLDNTEKHKGAAIKGVTATNCSPDSPQPAVLPLTSQIQKPAPTSPAKTEPGVDKTPPAISSPADSPTIKVAVNLVPVRVVVRDAQGHAVGSLRQEDFQLFDNRQPQLITRFSVERSEDHPGAGQTTPNPGSAETPAQSGKSAAPPERYIAYLFDDVHFNAAELTQVRDAANRHLAALQPADRAGVFTTSGQVTLDFTDDRAKLHETLLRVTPRPVAGSGGKDCPDIDPYMAYLIWSKKDEDALGVATEDALVCAFGSDARRAGRAAEAMAKASAQQQVAASDLQSQAVLRAFRNTLSKLAATPGQHILVLVSPGFVTPGREQDFTQLIDRALRANVIISTLDARGLFNLDSSVADVRPGVDVAISKIQYRRESAAASSDVLASLAEGTGGNFFHNDNNMDEGFKRTIAAPEFSYVLGFSPADLKPDGSFHNLNVTLKSPEKLTVQARKGYYAPRPAASRPTEPQPKTVIK
jgi:VWFA-related protein